MHTYCIILIISVHVKIEYMIMLKIPISIFELISNLSQDLRYT